MDRRVTARSLVIGPRFARTRWRRPGDDTENAAPAVTGSPQTEARALSAYRHQNRTFPPFRLAIAVHGFDTDGHTPAPEAPMIPRYSRPDMVAIWSPETRFRIWFEIEAHAADAMAELGIVPKAAAKKIWAKGKNAKFDVARIDEIERVTKHDVIAFLTHLAEIVGPEARFVHSGMTSSDVLDTCLNVQLPRSADILIADVDKLLAALKRRAFEHKKTPTVGPSH